MKVSINDPQHPKGTEIGISGLVAVPNGDSVEVDDDMLAAYEEERGMKLADAVKDHPTISLSGEGSKGGESKKGGDNS